MSGHTAWRAVGTVIYTGDGGFDIRDLPNAGERASLICSAVNSHAELVKALEGSHAMLQLLWQLSDARATRSSIDEQLKLNVAALAPARAALATLTARKVG